MAGRPSALGAYFVLYSRRGRLVSHALLAAEAPGLSQGRAPGLEGAGTGDGILQLLNDPEEQQDEQEEQKEEKREVEEQVELPLHGAAEAIPHELPRQASCSKEGAKAGYSAAPDISSSSSPLRAHSRFLRRVWEPKGRRRGKDRQEGSHRLWVGNSDKSVRHAK